jgi:hypothetical protein
MKADGSFDQPIFQDMHAKIWICSVLMNSNSRRCLEFCTTLHFKSAMPSNMKVVCLDKLHNFPIVRI